MLVVFADLLRGYLDFTASECVKADREIALIEAYVELEKLRLCDNCTVTFDSQLSTSGLMLPPLLLMPFVENAFKHGTHPNKPCFVHLRLRIEPGSLSFSVENSRFPTQDLPSTHIGQANVRRRLRLLYPDRHTLDVIASSTYRTTLIITL